MYFTLSFWLNNAQLVWVLIYLSVDILEERRQVSDSVNEAEILNN